MFSVGLTDRAHSLISDWLFVFQINQWWQSLSEGQRTVTGESTHPQTRTHSVTAVTSEWSQNFKCLYIINSLTSRFWQTSPFLFFSQGSLLPTLWCSSVGESRLCSAPWSDTLQPTRRPVSVVLSQTSWTSVVVCWRQGLTSPCLSSCRDAVLSHAALHLQPLLFLPHGGQHVRPLELLHQRRLHAGQRAVPGRLPVCRYAAERQRAGSGMWLVLSVADVCLLCLFRSHFYVRQLCL